MRIFTGDFVPIWPVGGGLIIAAESVEDAKEIARKTISHTSEFSIAEYDMTKPGVVVYLSGDY